MMKNRMLLIIMALIIGGTASFFFVSNKQSLSAPIFYVANAGDGTISKINIQSNTPVNSIQLNVEQLSHGIALKGMELNNISKSDKTSNDNNRSKFGLNKYIVENEVFAEGIEVKVQLLSPFDEENILLIISNIDIDPFQYFALKVEMTTHSGDLSSIPFAERTVLTNDDGDEIKADKWIVISNDSHHPQFLALFEKTVDKQPLLNNIDTKLSVKFRPFIKDELLINLSK